MPQPTILDYLKSLYMPPDLSAIPGQPDLGQSLQPTQVPVSAPSMSMPSPINVQSYTPSGPMDAPAQPKAKGLMDYLNNPDIAQALIGAGSSMLANSGPSRLPTTFGQLMGGGLNAGNQAYRQSQEGRLNDVLKRAQIAAALNPGSSGEQWRPMTAADRAKYGISSTDPNSWMISNTGDVKIAGGAGYGSNPADVEQAKNIAGAIMTGQQPPDMHGLYRFAGPVKSELAKSGYDLTKANQDWVATQKLLSTMNGAQQVRLRQSINQVSETLPLLKSLADQWNGGNFPILNKVNLAAAKQGAFGQAAQSLATRLDAEISDVTAELGTVYMGGNTPTDHSLELAAKQFQSNWSKQTFMDALDLADKNLTYRKNSLSLATGGIPDSQYNPSQQAASASAPTASAPASSSGGLTYDPSTGGFH